METLTIEPIKKLTKDIRDAVTSITEEEARFLVDRYYAMQDFRIQGEGQVRAAGEDGEPHQIITWFAEQAWALEREVHKALQTYAESKRAGRWALSQHGIGPVITAGLLAHIDIRKAPTVGHIWRFAGLDPTVRWERGVRRPWNARLKTLTWKIGESFKKFSNHEKCYYGHVYRKRKEQEIERNASRSFATQASESLTTRNIKDKKLRETYEDGRLPDGRLDLRAARYATKLFLSHFHHVLHESELGTPPPKPYVIEHLGHAHLLTPPGWPCA